MTTTSFVDYQYLTAAQLNAAFAACTAFADLSAAVGVETAARVAAVAAEAYTRAAADTAEATARAAAVTGEATARATAVTGEATARAAADTAEVTARNAAITAAKNISASPSISFAPTANTPTTLASFIVQGTTSATLQRQFMASIGLTSNSGHGTALVDKVSLYVGGDVVAGSSDFWTVNSCLTIEAGAPTDINVQGYELDFNNFNSNRGSTFGVAGMAAPVAVGLSISGVADHANTAAISIAGVGNQWYRGIAFTTGIYSAISDYSLATYGIEMIAAHSYGIDMFGSAQAVALRTGNNQSIQSRNSGNTADIEIAVVNAANNLTLGTGAAAIFLAAAPRPLTDNVWTLGDATHRFTTVYATTGAINTSDKRQKTDIEALPSTLDLVNAIEPQTYKWIVGGRDAVEVQEVQTVQATERVVTHLDDVEMRGGRAHHATRTIEKDELLFDDIPVVDDAGKPIMIEVPAVAEMRDERTGAVTRKARPATSVPRTHRAPRMVEKSVTVTQYVDRPGVRTHWGFVAGDVQAAFEKHLPGVDFAGYVKGDDEAGTEGLRPDQMLPVLWQALKELSAKVTALESTAGRR